MNASHVSMVDHLSATKIRIWANSTEYVPGQHMSFGYAIMDRFSNVIETEQVEPFSLTLQSESEKFSVTLDIDEYGVCAHCRSGILFDDLSMQNVGDVYVLKVLVDSLLFLD